MNKFRAWHKHNKKFIYFDFLDIAITGWAMSENYRAQTAPCDISTNEGVYATEEIVRYELSSKGMWFTSNPIMEFTHLRDKNEREIWESDIFKLNDQLYKVNKRSGCFMADNIHNGHSLTHSREDVRVWHTLMESSLLIEVLGNIYENPELLKR